MKYFLEVKDRPLSWGTTTYSSISPTNLDMIKDYLELGGHFLDLKLPYRYIKKVMDLETLKQLEKELKKRKRSGETQDRDLLIQTLHSVVLKRKPARGRKTRIFYPSPWIHGLHR